MSALQFGVLGPLRMTADGADLPLGSAKQRAVLAVLLINRNRPVAVDVLLNAAWRQQPPSEARASLHTYVSNLRRMMSTAGFDPSTILVSARPGYRLDVANAACDVGRFHVDLAAGVQAAAGGRFDQAARRLSAALAQWRAPVLDDLSEFEFAQAFAAALSEDKLVAQTLHAEAEIACGRSHLIITELEALAAEQPYREPLWAQLITAYYLSERQYDALAAYRRLKVTLADDLGIDPGPTLQALHERILRQEPLEIKRAALATAQRAAATFERRTGASELSAVAHLRDGAGRRYPLQGAVTRIGRLPDNDIVLDDATVSRHHAIVIDTGNSFAITDLRSANGVLVAGKQIRGTVTLDDGDRIRISDHEFTFAFGDL